MEPLGYVLLCTVRPEQQAKDGLSIVDKYVDLIPFKEMCDRGCEGEHFIVPVFVEQPLPVMKKG